MRVLLLGVCCVWSGAMILARPALAQQQPEEFSTESGGVVTPVFTPTEGVESEEKGPNFIRPEQLQGHLYQSGAAVTPQIRPEDVKVIPEAGTAPIQPLLPSEPGQVTPVPMPEPQAAPQIVKRPILTKEQMREVELLLVKGIIEFNGHRLVESFKLFRKAYVMDPASFVALEYLAKIADERGEHEEAIRLYGACRKIEPPDRKKLLNFYIADAYMKQNRVAMAERYFRLALRDGAFPIQTYYYLGYAALRQERWREAEAYFHESERLMGLVKNTKIDAQIAQPLHYYLGELYARLGYPRYSLIELYPAMQGKSKEVTKAAWALEDALDRPSKRLSVGLTGQYDSNAVGLPGDSADSSGFSSRSGYAVGMLLDLAAQTSPSRKWSFGGEYTMFLNRHQDNNLGKLDSWTHSPNAWASWWNNRDTEMRLRYDYTATRLDRIGHSYLYVQSQGPQLSWSRFADRRQQLDAWYAFRRNYYPSDLPTGDDQRSGSEHIAAFRAGIAAPNPNFLPYGQFSVDYTDTDGKNFTELTPTLELGTGYWVGTDARLNFGLSYGYGYFPNNLSGRRDSTLVAKTTGSMPISRSWMASVDLSMIDNISNLSDQFSYLRLLFTVGAIYVLPF